MQSDPYAGMTALYLLQIAAMMINRMPSRSQSMNLIHLTTEGSELWLGDYYAATKMPLLKENNIRSVLTAAGELNVVYEKQHQITHKRINANDIDSYRMTPHFEEAYQFIKEGLKRGNVLVHCAAGISRSTTFVIVFLMRDQAMSFNQALEYVRSKRAKAELKKYNALLDNLRSQSRNQKQKQENGKKIEEKQEKQEKREMAKMEEKMNGLTLQGKMILHTKPLTSFTKRP